MRVASILCLALAGRALATTTHWNARTLAAPASDSHADDADNSTGASRRDAAAAAPSPYEMPPCVQSCEDQFFATHSCEVGPTEDTDCCKPLVKTKLLSCIQDTCSQLEDLISWQQHRSVACHLTPRDQSVLQKTASYTVFVITAISIVARLLSRSELLSGPGFWWDDWVALIVWLFTLEMLICTPFVYENKLGMDVTNGVTAENIRSIMHWEYASAPFYLIGTSGAKIVLILLFLRMWEANTKFRKICWITIGAVLALITGFVIGGILLLWPLRYYVGETSRVRTSYIGIEIYPAILGLSACNVLISFWVLLLPIMKLAALRGIPKSKRIGISVVFLLGFTCTACSIVRMRYIPPLKDSVNPSWDYGPFSVVSAIETHLSIFTINLPAVSGLIHRLRLRHKGTGPLRISSTEELQHMSTTKTDSFITRADSDAMHVQAMQETPIDMEAARIRPTHGDGHIFRAHDDED